MIGQRNRNNSPANALPRVDVTTAGAPCSSSTQSPIRTSAAGISSVLMVIAYTGPPTLILVQAFRGGDLRCLAQHHLQTGARSLPKRRHGPPIPRVADGGLTTNMSISDTVTSLLRVHPSSICSHMDVPLPRTDGAAARVAALCGRCRTRSVMHQSSCSATRLRRMRCDTDSYYVGYAVQWSRRGRLGRASMEDPERHACWLGVQTGVRRVLSWRSGFLRRAQGERTPTSHVSSSGALRAAVGPENVRLACRLAGRRRAALRAA
jgi:hypothetical protein